MSNNIISVARKLILNNMFSVRSALWVRVVGNDCEGYRMHNTLDDDHTCFHRNHHHHQYHEHSVPQNTYLNKKNIAKSSKTTHLLYLHAQ